MHKMHQRFPSSVKVPDSVGFFWTESDFLPSLTRQNVGFKKKKFNILHIRLL